MIKCPKCNEFEIEEEDNRCDTDRGVYGCVNFFCERCGDVTEEVRNIEDNVNNELFKEDKKNE